MTMNRMLENGRGWEPCKVCELPCIISESWSVNGGTISHGCAACLAKDRNRLHDALKEAREVIALCTTQRSSSPLPEDAEAERVGSRHGYGALMSAASRVWARMFDGTPQEGGQHTSGPCEATVKQTLKLIDKAMGASLLAPPKRLAALPTDRREGGT